MLKGEHGIQSRIVDWSIAFAVSDPRLNHLIAIPNGAMSGDFMRVNYFKREGLKPGVPDLFLAIIAPPYGGLFLETKTARGKQSPQQKLWQKRLIDAGYRYELYRDFETGVDIVLNYLGIDPLNLDSRFLPT